MEEIMKMRIEIVRFEDDLDSLETRFLGSKS